MRNLPPFLLLPRLLLPAFVGMATLLAACSSGGSSNADAVTAATAQNEQKINAADVTTKQEADATFLVEVSGNALLEVELGKLAQARATTPALRSYGPRLVQDRLALLAAVRALANSKGLAVPPTLGGDQQAAYHEASIKTGAELDKYTAALMVKAQKQDEDAFDDMKDDAYDGDIRGFAAKYLHPVQEQLAAAKEAAEAVEDAH